MSGRGFNVIVALMWLAATTWLFQRQILPDLLIGDPPNYPRVLDARSAHPTVGWIIECDGEGVGWAVSSLIGKEHSQTLIENYLHFNNLPLSKLVPEGLRPLLGVSDRNSKIAFSAASDFEFTSLGQLSRMNSAVRFRPFLDPLRVQATVDGPDLQITVQQGQYTWEGKTAAPRQAMLVDALSPQTDLPGLRAGQNWTIEVYNPLQPLGGGTPRREVLHAVVEGKSQVTWRDKAVEAWVVVYRGESTSGWLQERGRVWVHPGGTVLRQQVQLFGCELNFLRLPDEQAVAQVEMARVEKANWERQRGEAHSP